MEMKHDDYDEEVATITRTILQGDDMKTDDDVEKIKQWLNLINSNKLTVIDALRVYHELSRFQNDLRERVCKYALHGIAALVEKNLLTTVTGPTLYQLFVGKLNDTREVIRECALVGLEVLILRFILQEYDSVCMVLTRCLHDRVETNRHSAMQLLVQLVKNSVLGHHISLYCKDIFLMKLSDPSDTMRLYAIKGLREILRTIQLNYDELNQIYIILMQRTKDDNSSVRCRVLYELSKYAENGQFHESQIVEVTEAFVSNSMGDSVPCRDSATRGLALLLRKLSLPDNDFTRVFYVFFELSSDTNESTREHAIIGLTYYIKYDKIPMNEFTNMLYLFLERSNDTCDYVRDAAVSGLYLFVKQCDLSRDFQGRFAHTLIHCTNDHITSIKTNALWGLRELAKKNISYDITHKICTILKQYVNSSNRTWSDIAIYGILNVADRQGINSNRVDEILGVIGHGLSSIQLSDDDVNQFLDKSCYTN